MRGIQRPALVRSQAFSDLARRSEKRDIDGSEASKACKMLYPKTAPILLNSTVAAARARVRGPTLSEQRAEQQRKEMEAIEAAQATREQVAAAKAAANGERAVPAVIGASDVQQQQKKGVR